jgi:CHAD domain-containing protein
MTSAAASPAVLKTLRRLLRSRWRQVAKHGAQIESGEGAKPVHDLRVTTRRLQELILLAAEVSEKPAAANTVKALREARRLCGGVRNADVLRGMVRARAGRSARQAQIWEPVAKNLARRRTQELARLRRSLARVNLQSLSERWLRALEKWPTADERRVRSRLNEHLAKRMRQFQVRREIATRADAVTEDIHRMRLSGKRLRYALEAARDFSDARAREALKRMRTFQDTLGDWNDLDMLCESVIERCSRKKFLRNEPESAQRLLQTMERERATQEAKLRRAMAMAEDMSAVTRALDEVTSLAGNSEES